MDGARRQKVVQPSTATCGDECTWRTWRSTPERLNDAWRSTPENRQSQSQHANGVARQNSIEQQEQSVIARNVYSHVTAVTDIWRKRQNGDIRQTRYHTCNMYMA